MGPTAIAACVLLVSLQMAQAAPSEEEIAAAQAAEKAAKMSIVQTETKFAEINVRAATTTQNAQTAGKDLSEVNIALSEAAETATRTSFEVNAAEAVFQGDKQQVASAAQVTYRGGGGTLDSLAPYLDSDGPRTIETKRADTNSFSSSVGAKIQNVVALEQVARVTRDATNSALTNQQAVTGAAKARTDAANKAAAVAQNEAVIVAAQRGAYMQESATKQNATVDLINQHETAFEAERQKVARIAAEQAAVAAGAQHQVDAAAAAATATVATSSQTSSSSDDEDDDGDYSYFVSSYSAPSCSYGEPSYSAPSYSGGGTDTAIATVKSYLGVSYAWGGGSYSGVDCSGSITLVWESASVDLPHLSYAQYSYDTHVPIDSMRAGNPISWSSGSTQSGICHVATYLGGGQMIEAPTFGVPARITGVYSWGSIMLYAVRL